MFTQKGYGHFYNTYINALVFFNGDVIFLVRVIFLHFVSAIQCFSTVPVNILHNHLSVVVFL